MEANGYEPAEPMFNIYHVSPHEQWLFGGEQYTAPVLKAIDEFMGVTDPVS